MGQHEQIEVVADAAATAAQLLLDGASEMTPEAFRAAAHEHVLATYRSLVAVQPLN